MASATNSTTLTTPGNGQYTLTAYFNENSTSTSNNTSSITVKATLYSTRAAFQVYNAGTLSIYWHDNNTNQDTLKGSTPVTQCGDIPDYYFGSAEVEVTFDASHKNDGTLSGYAIAKWEKSNYGTYGYLIPASGNVSTSNTALTNIARAGNFTATNVTIGENITISTQNGVYGFTYVFMVVRNGTTYPLYSTTFRGTLGSASWSFQFPLYMYNLLGASEKQAQVTLQAETYNGNTLIGTTTSTFTMYANPNDTPTVTISSVDTGKAIINGTNRTSLDLTGSNKRIINQWNTMSATWTASTGYNTNIANVSINGTTVTTSPTTLNNVSNFINITATNGRGYSKTITESDLTFVSYEPPSIVPTIKRNTATDGHVNLTFTGMFYNINFGAESNALTLNWYVREKGTQNYTQGATSLTYTSNSDNKTYVNSAVISLVNPLDQVDGLFDYQKTYEFKFVVTDKVTSYTISEVVLTKGIPNFVVFKDAVLANGHSILGETLWENENPTNSFSSTTLYLTRNVENYTKIEVLFNTYLPDGNFYYYNTMYDYNHVNQISYVIIDNGTIKVRNRTLKFYKTITNKTAILWGDGYINSTLNNNVMVPIKIIGYK